MVPKIFWGQYLAKGLYRFLRYFALILMGDWCSEAITDTIIQRNYGNSTVASIHRAGYVNNTLARKYFSSNGVVFSLDEGLLMGDP